MSIPARSVNRPEVAIAGLLVLAATLYFMYAASWSYVWQLRAHSSFVPVQATVLEASVQTRGSGAATSGQTFSPRIVYRYRVDGTDHLSDRYFFTGDGWADAAAAQAQVARSPVGSAIEVYVHADKPEVAVIDRSQPKLGVLLFLLPVAAAALALLAYGLGLPRPRSKHHV